MRASTLLRIEGQLTWRGSISVGSALLEDAKQSDEACLDLIDGTLQIFAPNNGASALALLLDAGHSVWTVAEDGQSLARVVSDESQATYEAATSVVDLVTAELKEAWAKAFGRKPDPSDAWDHAVKSMEALLIPLVVPNQRFPDLGHVVGQLDIPGRPVEDDLARQR